MRSRYTAFALGGHGDYLLESWHVSARQGLSAASLAARSTRWTGLKILKFEQQADRGMVEFAASFSDKDGSEQVHHEESLFVRENGKWFYLRAAE